MKRLSRDHLFFNEGNLETLPTVPPLEVELGESFLIETVDTEHRNVLTKLDINKSKGPMAGNPWTGPVYVHGINVGDVIAVHIEDISIQDNCFLTISDESLLPSTLIEYHEHFIPINDGLALFPGGFRIPVFPMFGCFGIVPLSVQADPYSHGGNMDIPSICTGNIVHIRCEREGGYFACGDGHALQGEGEINGYSLEVSLLGQIRIEKSPYQSLQTILIETPDEFIGVGIKREIVESTRDVVFAMAELLSLLRKVSLLESYQVVSHVGNIRFGAMWPLWSHKQHIPIPICLHLKKELFMSI